MKSIYLRLNQEIDKDIIDFLKIQKDKTFVIKLGLRVLIHLYGLKDLYFLRVGNRALEKVFKLL